MKETTSGLAKRIGLADEQEQIKREINAIYNLLSGMLGTDQLILKAGKLEALTLLRSRKPGERVLGLQKLIFENPSLNEIPPPEKIPQVLEELYDALAERIARRSVEEALEMRVTEIMQEKQEEYLLDIKRQLLKEQSGPENPQTLKKFAELEKKKRIKLSHSTMEILRPQKISEIIGQETAVSSLLAKLSSPYPQHIIIYGPPGVGKTTASRLALEEAKKIKHSAFFKDAPFVEVDGSTLRWDPRESTNPLLGSVHDPIYQGARRDLIEGGIPEPKPGLVTEAHGGVLFIDEIGEMDIRLQSKFLKVLEDKKVYFESAYYDPTDRQVPKYIHQLFQEGAPADFILICATTRSPRDINPALRSRCAAVYFEPLTPQDVQEIVKAAACKLPATLEEGAAELISRYTTEGRQAVNLLSDAFGMAIYRHKGRKKVVITCEIVLEVLRAGRYIPNSPARNSEEEYTGKIFGLAVNGFLGSILEIEAVAFPARQEGKGSMRFNETAGSMTRDSVFNAAAVIRRLTGEDLKNYDLHVNVIGGAMIDGPSAGLAVAAALLSAIWDRPISQKVAVTGEISLQGYVKAVGGIPEKLYGARQAGIETVIIPYANKDDVPDLPGMRVIPVKTVEEALPWIFPDRQKKRADMIKEVLL
ncbi:MAG: Lon family ATP-dependent protease [Bacillota bacterium]|jgi:ATP-dependent Lon protease|nr:Lon family ATP-dependent protease [Bacillota bacterium]